MNLNHFNYGLTLANELYDIEMQDNNYLEVALIAYSKIGNKICRMYKAHYDLDCDHLSVELPCNCEDIEAVTTELEDWTYVSNLLPNGDLDSAFTEGYIEGRKAYKDKLYILGRFAKYDRVGNTLYFSEPYSRINILYYGRIVDDEGLPLITDEEAYAIAAYIAYTLKFKEGLKTNNANTIQLAEQLKREWLIQCDLARTAYVPTLNDMNEILDAKTNWNRKQFGKSYKVVK